MRDDEILSRLREVNPWWRAAAAGLRAGAWAADDRVLRDRDRYDLGYRADVLRDVASAPPDDRLVILRGPRRVGKSVALKDCVLACALAGMLTRGRWSASRLTGCARRISPGR